MAFKTIVRWHGKYFNEKNVNKLRSKNHSSLSGNHFLITMTGRRSGKQYTLPVNYKRTPENTFVIGTEGNWWHNLKGGSPVQIEVAGKTMRAHAMPIIDDTEKRDRLGRLISGPLWVLFSKALIVIEITVEAQGK